jgi:hypothetical protein
MTNVASDLSPTRAGIVETTGGLEQQANVVQMCSRIIVDAGLI